MTLTYGEYGGRYVPETLIPALEELEAGWHDAQSDPAFAAELDELARTYAGRPDAAHAGGALRAGQAAVPEARRPAPHRRAQAEQRARTGGARAPARQAAHRRRDRRRASTAWRRRRCARASASTASCTWASEDMRRQRPERRAHGAARRGGAPRRVRHAHAEGGDERGDPRLDHERRDDALPDRLGGRAASVSGDRARAAGRDRTRGARAVPRGRGAAAGGRRRVRRRRLERDRDVRRVPRRRGRAARRRRGVGRGVARRRAAPASSTARARRSSPTRTGRSSTRTRSPPASTIRASAPSTRRCATAGARTTSARPTRRRSRRFAR